MKREIKFRAWDKREKRMGEVNYIKFGGAVYPFASIRFKQNEKVIDEWYHFGMEDGSDSITLMQYTGLKDKNGKEIYEGDIYKDCEGLMCEVVSHDNGFKGLYISHRSYQGEKYTEKVYIKLRNTVDRRWGVEVIGNIHENKELLEVK